MKKEYRADFYEDGKRIDSISNDFINLVGDITYQYYELEYGNRKLFITPTAPHPPHQERFEFCVSHRNYNKFNGKTVIDIGGAEGFYSIKASLLGASKITLVERSAKRIEIAKFIADFFRVRNIEYVVEDIRDYKFNQYKDITFLMRIIHWLDRLDRKVLLDRVAEYTKLVTFINLDGEMIDETIINSCKYYKFIIPRGMKFMGALELWK